MLAKEVAVARIPDMIGTVGACWEGCDGSSAIRVDLSAKVADAGVDEVFGGDNICSNSNPFARFVRRYEGDKATLVDMFTEGWTFFVAVGWADAAIHDRVGDPGDDYSLHRGDRAIVVTDGGFEGGARVVLHEKVNASHGQEAPFGHSFNQEVFSEGAVL
jgi:hypothetical protein